MPPKRKRAAETSAPKGAKKTKASHTPTRRSPRHNTSDDAASQSNDSETKPAVQKPSKAFKPPATDEDHEWQILDGDSRETLLVGVTAPNRLRLRFRHRTNKQAGIAVHQYKKAAHDVDWSSKEDIMDINKWRNQVFIRTMKFPPKVARTSWTPFETAYLELLHEKLKHSADGNEKFTMPPNTRILEAFNGYFEYRDDIRDAKGEVVDTLGARQMGQLTSYMSRQGSKLRQLRKDLAKYKTSNDANVSFPTMTDTEIQNYLNGNGVIDSSNEDAVSEEPAQDPLSPSPPPTTKRPKPPKPQKPSNASPNPPTTSSPRKKPRWVKPKETPATPTSPTRLASLKSQGYKFTLPPATDAEALEAHKDTQSKNKPDTTWLQQATTDLSSRIARRTTTPGTFNHELFNRDTHDAYDTKGAMKNVEDWHQVSARRDGAAGVTGLLNAADIPPHGYMGDIRDLYGKRVLTEAELEVADAREVGVKRKWDAIERMGVERENGVVQRGFGMRIRMLRVWGIVMVGRRKRRKRKRRRRRRRKRRLGGRIYREYRMVVGREAIIEKW